MNIYLLQMCSVISAERLKSESRGRAGAGEDSSKTLQRSVSLIVILTGEEGDVMRREPLNSERINHR